MKSMILALFGLAAMVGSSFAAPKTPIPSTIYRFAGFSNPVLPVLGGIGFIGMHATCQFDFGPDARMCTSAEFWLSPNAAAAIPDAWLHPVDGGAGPGRVGTAAFVGRIDVGSGESCRAWSSSLFDDRGFTVGVDGHFAGVRCNVPSPVTCCLPVQ